MVASAVEWSISDKDLAKFVDRLEKFRGLPLRARMQRATLAAAEYMVKPIKAGSPVKTGYLKKSVKARQAKKRMGTTLAPGIGALAGPTAPHRHLVIRGHRIVTPGGTFTGRTSRVNPYVDNAMQRHSADAYRIVNKALMEGGSVLGSSGRVADPFRKRRVSSSVRKQFGA